eukprot:COSAG05_NODE_333_length_11249_cov_629.633094_13_plen_96_part_01
MATAGAAADLAWLGHEALSVPDDEERALTQKVLTQKTDTMLRSMVKRYIDLAEAEKGGDRCGQHSLSPSSHAPGTHGQVRGLTRAVAVGAQRGCGG